MAGSTGSAHNPPTRRRPRPRQPPKPLRLTLRSLLLRFRVRPRRLSSPHQRRPRVKQTAISMPRRHSPRRPHRIAHPPRNSTTDAASPPPRSCPTGVPTLPSHRVLGLIGTPRRRPRSAATAMPCDTRAARPRSKPTRRPTSCSKTSSARSSAMLQSTLPRHCTRLDRRTWPTKRRLRRPPVLPSHPASTSSLGKRRRARSRPSRDPTRPNQPRPRPSSPGARRPQLTRTPQARPSEGRSSILQTPIPQSLQTLDP